MRSLYPRDVVLNVPPEIYSHGVRRRVAAEFVRRGDATTIEKTTVRAAAAFEAFDDSRAAATRAHP